MLKSTFNIPNSSQFQFDQEMNTIKRIYVDSFDT